MMHSFIGYVGYSVVANPDKGIEIAKRAKEITDLYNCNCALFTPEILGDRTLDDLSEAVQKANYIFTCIDNLKSFINEEIISEESI